MNNEFSTLLADLKEQILFMQELGVENLSVDLPSEISDFKFQTANSKAQIPTERNEISRERLERFVPPDDIIKIIAPKAVNNENTEVRQNPLEASKLSRLPSLSKRLTNYSNLTNNLNSKPEEKIEMPKKPPVETLTESLFGDLTQTLPESKETIEQIRLDIGNCMRCPLHEGRTKIVHSTGNLQAELMFVGEAPGADEDQQGLPFVGRAGQLLNKIIEAISLKREDVFIGNINRCRPPGNRAPTLPEAETCKPFLLREIAVVRPKVIVVMGNTACQNLLNTKVGITKLRGNFQDYYGVKVMPTFHPAYLLRDPSKKREVWEDMKIVRDYLNKLK
jgi:uracil-DNA glycosylase